MKKSLIIVLLVLIGFVAGLFYYFHGKEYTLKVPQNIIQEKLAEKLPINKQYLKVFNINIDNMQAKLLNGSNRINVNADADLTITSRAVNKEYSGTIECSSGLEYRSEEGAFYLVNPVIHDFSIENVPQDKIKKFTALFEKALAEYFKKYPVYKLSSLDSKQAAAKMLLKGVVVEDEALHITLGI